MLSETTQSTRIKVKSATMPITGGPSREDLFDALRLGSTVTYTAGSSTRFEIVITALEREDGSGDNWNFKGFIKNRNPHDRTTTNVRGSYNTRTRARGQSSWCTSHIAAGGARFCAPPPYLS